MSLMALFTEVLNVGRWKRCARDLFKPSRSLLICCPKTKEVQSTNDSQAWEGYGRGAGCSYSGCSQRSDYYHD